VCAAVGRRIVCSACVPGYQHGGGGLPREPWIVAVEHESQTPELIPALPAAHHPLLNNQQQVGVVSHGCDSPAVRSPGHLQEGRQGLRAHRRTRTPPSDRDGDHLGSTTNQILALREHLATAQVTCVVMEATGDYWKPFYYLLEDLDGVEVMLVNAREAKNLPGRKTSPMRPGLPSSAPMGWCALRSCHRRRSENSGTSPGLAPRSPGNGLVRCNGWRSCWRTPASSCPRWPPTSSGSPAGRCSKPWLTANATRACWPTWPRSGCAPRRPSWSKH
jgi:hypothetical protein